jgi:ureidoglycolate lyase
MNLLRPRPLDPRAFAPYGDVIEAGAAAHRYEINEGTTTRFHDLARIEPGRGGRAIVSIFRCRAGDGSPVTIRMMERHPRGSQAFVPLGGGPWLVVVAPPGETVAADAIEAFVARGDQGINIAPGVWHHPLIPSAVERDFLVIDRDGEGENCDVIELSVERVLDTGP